MVAFAVIGLVLAVLIMASVVSAAVIASYRRIGVLKSIGFTPAQVAATYLAQIGVPALAGASRAPSLGNWWVLPLLNVGRTLFKINLSSPAMDQHHGARGNVRADRAGRASPRAARRAAVRGAGDHRRAGPAAGHGYAAHRLAGRLPLPRPVTIGLAAPFTRPARSAVTLAAITFGLPRWCSPSASTPRSPRSTQARRPVDSCRW